MDIQRPRGAAANGVIPVGGIIMWSGTIASIPTNWALCDGANGTPDLRDKFIVGANQDDSGIAKTNLTGSLTQSGGNANHTHSVTSNVTVADHAAHVHSGSGDHASHTHTYTEVINHVHVQRGTTTATGNFSGQIIDTSAGGTGGAISDTTTGHSTQNPTGSVGATGTTAGPSATLTHGNTGNPTATITHTPTNNAVTSGNNSQQPPYFALAFIMRTA